MSERIDHVAKALAYLQPEYSSPEKAQVHATLELAEQQRIANLIALFKHDPNGETEACGAPSDFAWEALGKLADDSVREALGL